MMNVRQAIGKKGEELAQKYLQENEFIIVERNFVCDLGEADIIATKDNMLFFIEVKTRTQSIYGSPAEAVDIRKQKHIYKVAEFYIYKNKIKNVPISLDVIEVYIFDDAKPKIYHIQNAILEKPYKLYRGA